MGYLPFVESFVLKAFEKDFNMIANLPMFVDLQAVFAKLLFYYAYQLGYV
jgi:hypothetical protein